ncbi:hypothetical protein E2C01_085566 [Portunus trituberculatus]|uniref:Uncharacterized protein n=1 Tax=Portunus trituberculatus TaxID=210409 RepID=A0A5B7J333_PORTR|nr:hypothetical protein [Portunus trituberculatus]
MTPHMKLLIVLPILDIALVIKNVHRGTMPLSLDFSDLPCLAFTKVALNTTPQCLKSEMSE